MNLEESKKLCRKAWENDYECLQTDRFVKTKVKIGILLEIVMKQASLECTLERESFNFLYINKIYALKKIDEFKNLEE